MASKKPFPHRKQQQSASRSGSVSIFALLILVAVGVLVWSVILKKKTPSLESSGISLPSMKKAPGSSGVGFRDIPVENQGTSYYPEHPVRK